MTGGPQETPQDRNPHFAPQRWLTADVPGIGGVIRQRPEDFLVEEIPLYQPEGTGEHIYMFVEKTHLSTFELIEIVARHFGVRRDAVGYAGLKDRVAITRQVLSVHTPGKRPEDFPSLEHDRVAIHWVDLHTNKLRQGHLAGNRFSVRIRNVKPTDVRTAQTVLRRLEKSGVPNRYGEQRFGIGENNHLVGRALLLADFDEAVREILGPNPVKPELNTEARRLFAQGQLEEALRAFPRSARAERTVLRELIRGKDHERAVLAIDDPSLNFFVSAFQSAVFNRVLDQRLAQGTFDTLLEGDLAMKHANRALFAVDRPVLDDPATPERVRTFEISPTGPLWGKEMMRATGTTDRAEIEALAAAGVSPEQVLAFGTRHPRLIEGARRPLRVPVSFPEVEGGVDEHGAYVRVGFELPRGSFATVVLREIMKPAPGILPEDEP